MNESRPVSAWKRQKKRRKRARERARSEVASDFLSPSHARGLVNTWPRCFRRIKRAIRRARRGARPLLMSPRPPDDKQNGVAGMCTRAVLHLGRSDAPGDSSARKDPFLGLLVSGGALLKIHYSYDGIDRLNPLGISFVIYQAGFDPRLTACRAACIIIRGKYLLGPADEIWRFPSCMFMYTYTYGRVCQLSIVYRIDWGNFV